MRRWVVSVAACALVSMATALHAQRGGPPGGGGGPRGGGMNPHGMPGGGGGFPSHDGPMGSGGGMGRPNDTQGRPLGPPPGSPESTSTMRGGLQLGPPGRWWDDKSFAKAIGLRKDQQKKMDSVFNANKSAILETYRSLVREESKLEAATREPQLDKSKIFAGIDAVNQARAAAEKAKAQMLLQIRQEMDVDQVGRMEKFREKPPEDPGN